MHQGIVQALASLIYYLAIGKKEENLKVIPLFQFGNFPDSLCPYYETTLPCIISLQTK